MTQLVPRPQHPAGLDLPAPPASVHISGVCLDSRAVRPGDLYVALPGHNTHGAQFASQAVERGAVAILTDVAGAASLSAVGVPVLLADDPRTRMGAIAADVYGRPADRMAMYGVTGTNGKTSTVFLLQAALEAVGRSVGTIGTLGTRLRGEQVSAARGTITTPDSPDLQGILGYLVEAGADTVAMEVSSIGLDQRRVEWITFDVAAWTMFGHDHLDYHGTAEHYFDAKTRLFLDGRTRTAVVNIDDEGGCRLVELLRAEGRTRVVTVSPHGSPADFRVTSAVVATNGSTQISLDTPAGAVHYGLTMVGAFNVANSLTALAMVGAGGGDVATAATGLRGAFVPGRMQRVPAGDTGLNVVVDFAHTPEAVEAALTALPSGGRRIVVLGAGGNREVQKRPQMGAAAARHADLVLVTDDNPRFEQPEAIRAEVLRGAREAGGSALVLDGGDRRTAIATALAQARPGDWVAILGKGHERTQEVAGAFLPFDDVAVVGETLGTISNDPWGA